MTSMAARTSAERDYQILIVDDDQMVQQLYAGLLARQAARPCTIHQAASGGAGLAALQAQTFDCVLLDFRLPDMNGLDFLACSAVDGVLPCAFVLVTAQGSEATAVEAMKRGVQDYLVKGLMDLGHLWNVLERATTEVRLRQKLAQTTRDLEHRSAELASLNGALGRSEARFRSLVEAAPNAFAMINADGRIKMVNAQTERLFGYSRTELLGAPVEMLLPARLRAGPPDLGIDVFQPASRPLARQRELFGLRKDGSEFEVEIGLNSIETDEGRMVLSAIVDISGRVRLESELRQSQKMEVIGRLAAGVSHDFNNILQVISNAVEILKEEQMLSSRGGGFLDMIDQATSRASHLTHHLLSYARKQMLQPQLLDLREVLEKLATFMSLTLGSDIAVTTEVAALIGLVSADRSLLETALMNLAINASHAMPNGGTLHFEINRAEAALFGDVHPGRHLVIAVSDTGTGMPPEVLACIFDPFFTTKGMKGTGLGLAMVQGFSRQSGGDVRVMSKLGEGTRFEIWLPEVEAEEFQSRPVEQVENDVQNGRVLLVDDEADMLITLSAILHSSGFAVCQASDGNQALAILETGDRFDLLITDYMMPGMKAPELIGRARQIQAGLLALVISGFADSPDLLADLPDTKTLMKPFRGGRFIAQVGALVAQRKRSLTTTVDALAGC